jgi:HNH endonuclease
LVFNDIGFKYSEKRILDSLLPGSTRWEDAKDIDCLETCPYGSSCEGNGPDEICSTEWRESRLSSYSLHVVIHILENYSHYDQGDLGAKKGAEARVLKRKLIDYLEGSVNDEFDEGSPYLKSHLVRERNSAEALSFKLETERNGGLRCESCEINFSTVLGRKARSVVECHHSIPISTPEHGGKTKRMDLVLLCATCHRIAHTEKPVLRPDQVAKKLSLLKGVKCYMNSLPDSASA